jgi:non-ribosomal peptide synthetase component F/acyl carrier protein
MLEHRTLVNLIYFQFTKTDVDFSGRVLQFASPAFDISPQEIFSTLLSGGTLYPVSSDMKGDIPRFSEFLETNRISIVFLPPAFLTFIFSEPGYAVKFSASVRHIIAAGEQLVVTEFFRHHLKNNRVYLHNHYGPAETHVVTTLTLDPGENIPEFPSIGGPISNTGIYILDPNNKLVPIGLSGELYIAGTAVGRGYLNRPELTYEKLLRGSRGHLRCGDKNVHEDDISFETKYDVLALQMLPHAVGPGRRRHFKTGDLARWLQDGTIEFLGRMDYQVKIRGFRIELGEIERQLMNINGIKEAVVIDREDSRGDKSLCAYIVADIDDAGTKTVEKVIDSTELRDYLSHILPDFMVPSYFMQIDRVPLTFNGKVNRKALPLPELKTGETYAPPTNHIERRLAAIWSEVLGRDGGVLPASIGIDDNFFDLGGHSLKATVMIARTHKELSVKIPLGEIFKMPTIRALALYIMAAEKEFYISIEPMERREYYPASSAQKRMYIINRLKLENTSDNTPDAVTVNGPLKKSRLEWVVQKLIERHEPLRTSFHLVDDEPIQKVHETVEFEIEYYNLAAKAVARHPKTKNREEIIKNFIRIFDLSKAPLLRVGLVQIEEGKYLLMYDMHHIIKDGSSSGIFIREFMDLYEGSPLPEPRLQYRDFTAWQNRMLQQGGMKKQEEFWLNVFPGQLPRLEMPTDFPRPAHQGFEGDCIDFYMDAGETAKIKAAAAETDATLYMVLLSIYNILLSKYCGQEDIVVGTPAAGRPHADLENMIGMFVNTLAMRSRPKGEKTFRQFLEEVKSNSLKAFENQDYQFDMLVNRLAIQPDPSRQSLFDTMFAVHDMSFIKGPAGRKIKDLEFESYPFENNITQFDIVTHAVEERGIIVFRLFYCTKLFKRETMEMFVECYKEVASIVVENTSIQLKDIAISHRLAAAETHMPAVEFAL